MRFFTKGLLVASLISNVALCAFTYLQNDLIDRQSAVLGRALTSMAKRDSHSGGGGIPVTSGVAPRDIPTATSHEIPRALADKYLDPSETTELPVGGNQFVAENVDCHDGRALVAIKSRKTIEYTQYFPLQIAKNQDKPYSEPEQITCDPAGGFQVRGKRLSEVQLALLAMSAILG